MTPERWQRITEIFEAVAGLDDKEVARVLDEHCGEDEALRREVESLLAAEPDSAGWMAGLAARSGIPAAGAEAELNVPGRQIGAWSLIRRIGRGGMGIVYLVERSDEAFSMLGALKTLPVGLTTEESANRFRRERDILARLEHPNIARMIDGGVTPEGTPYYVMEYVQGEPLDRVGQRMESLEERLALFRKILSAVAYAHRHLIIHRDIKPSNILVTAEGEPKLLDFGVAKLIAVESPHAATATQLAERRVTPAYTAPELLAGDSVTTACDVYSLGVTLYQLLSGESPFEPGFFEHSDWTDRLATHRPPPPSQVAPAFLARRLHGDLDNIVGKAMHPDAERRYGTVAELVDDLDRFRLRLPVRARPDTIRYRVGRFLSRHALGAGLGAALVLTLSAGMAASTYFAIQAANEAELARSQRDRAETVSDFLTSTFAAANPNAVGDLETRMRNVLEGIDLGTGDAEPRHPLTRADLLLSYAVVARAVGELGMAEEAGREALAMLRSAGADRDKLSRGKLNLANTLLQSGGLGESETLLREAMAEWPLKAGAHEAAFQSRITLLHLLARDRRGPQERLEILSRMEPFEPEIRDFSQRLWISYELARLQTLVHAGRYQATLENGRRLVDWLRENRRPEHPFLASALTYVSAALFQLGRAEEAAPLDREVLRIYRESLGEHHPHTVNARNQLATSLSQQGRYDMAVEFYQKAIDGWTRIHGEEHRNISRALLNISQVHRRQGNTGKALEFARRAYAMDAQLLGADHPQAGLTRILFARALSETGKLDSAAGHFESGLDAIKEAWGAEHPVVLRLRAEYARYLVRRGEPARAMSLIDRIRPGLLEAYGDHGIYPALARAYRGLAAGKLDRTQQAVKDIRAARRVIAAEQHRTKYPQLLELLELRLERLSGR